MQIIFVIKSGTVDTAVSVTGEREVVEKLIVKVRQLADMEGWVLQ